GGVRRGNRHGSAGGVRGGAPHAGASSAARGGVVKITALVVDDEPLARRKLAALIADVPWAVQVGEARDGPSALESVRRLRPDVVFLGIQMPELSGNAVVARLRMHVA